MFEFMNYQNLSLIFQSPLWLYLPLLALSIVLAHLSYRVTNPPLERNRKRILKLLRAIAFFTLFAAILDPIFSAIKSYQVEPVIPVLVDNTQSIRIGYSDQVKQFLESGKLKSIEKAHVNFCAFDNGVDTSFISGNGTSVGGGTSVGSGTFTLNFDGEATGIGRSLLDILALWRPEDIYSVVVISDGRNNVGELPSQVASTYPVPIYTIGVGEKLPAKDIVLTQVVADKVAYVGKEMTIRVFVSSYGFKGEKVPVYIYEGKKRVAGAA